MNPGRARLPPSRRDEQSLPRPENDPREVIVFKQEDMTQQQPSKKNRSSRIKHPRSLGWLSFATFAAAARREPRPPDHFFSGSPSDQAFTQVNSPLRFMPKSASRRLSMSGKWAAP